MDVKLSPQPHEHGVCILILVLELCLMLVPYPYFEPARSVVDLTLEQTINKDAASRYGSIGTFTQNVNTRKRWTVTRSFRGAVVSCLL